MAPQASLLSIAIQSVRSVVSKHIETHLLFQTEVTDFTPELRLYGVDEGLGDYKSVPRLDWVSLLNNLSHSLGLHISVVWTECLNTNTLS